MGMWYRWTVVVWRGDPNPSWEWLDSQVYRLRQQAEKAMREYAETHAYERLGIAEVSIDSAPVLVVEPRYVLPDVD